MIFSTDETATEHILKAEQSYASLCGKLNMTLTRDAFITALCKASLPPNYHLTVLNMYAQPGVKGEIILNVLSFNISFLLTNCLFTL